MIEHAGFADTVVRPTFTLANGAHDAAAADAHVARCPSCRASLAAIRADTAALAALDIGDPAPWVRARVLRAAAGGRSAWRRTARLLVFTALVVGGMAGGAVGAGALLGEPRGTADPPRPPDLEMLVAGKSIIWKADAALLAADRIELTLGAKQLSPSSVRVDGDPGSLKRSTLEVAWAEGGLEQRIYLYFASDGVAWWLSEASVYDNVAPSPDWTYLAVDKQRIRLGQALTGDIVLEGVGRSGPARLQITGAVLEMVPQPNWVDPQVGGGPLTRDPFEPGAALHCSGILQLSPQLAERELKARGLRLSWRFQWGTGANSGYSDIRLEAPPTGWINGTALGSDGELILFVADPNRPFGGPPLPLPRDCAQPSPG